MHGGNNALYTYNGGYPDNLDNIHATSPPVDVSSCDMVLLSYWRRLGVESSSFDMAFVSVTDAGSGPGQTGAWVGVRTRRCAVAPLLRRAAQRLIARGRLR